MEPHELKKRLDEKKAKSAANAAQERARLDAQVAERKAKAEEGRAALKDVVIPYFKELQKTFGKDLTFDPSAQMDLSDMSPVAVSFKFGDGAVHVIEVSSGNVRIYWTDPATIKVPAGPKRGKPPFQIVRQFVFPGTAEPFIATPADLTREKLSKLVDMAIQGN